MKRKLLLLVAAFATSASYGALAELNVAEGTIESPDQSFVGRSFKILDGFKLELLYVAPTNEGKWVAVGWDDKGRLLVPSYNSDVLTRLTIPKVGSNEQVKSELVTTTRVGAAEGVLSAFGSIYINANRSTTMQSGLYRLTDTNGDDKLDQTRVINNVRANGDHGTHTLQLSPDRQRIFVIQGNATRMTEHTTSRVPEIWGEDNLLMRMDLTPPGFHRAPDATITDFNADGTVKELFAMGMRNPVSFAFNKDGEMFVYDADEEPNMGFTVGYRPTNIQHVISGADMGWRSGSKVHPYYYFDYFAPIADVGSGSPVGSAFGTGTKFPAQFQDAFFAGDWSFGNLWAVTLTPDGSSYKANVLPFMSGKPFAVSGIIANPADGSLLIATTGSELYRVTYVGGQATDPTKPDTRFAALRDQRHALEKFHGTKNPAAVTTAWPFLNDPDRAIRYAARTAIEWQDPVLWREKAIVETDPRRSIAAIVALARVSSNDIYHTPPNSPDTDDKALEDRMISALDRIDWNSLGFQDKLDLLRAYQLVMIRLGQPGSTTTQRLIAKFDPLLPANQQELNRMLSEILIYLQAPSAAQKVMTLLRNAPDEPYFGVKEWPNPQLRQRQDRGEVQGSNTGVTQLSIAKQDAQIYYAQLLRSLEVGWTPDLRKEFMEYFVTAPKGYAGSMNGLAVIRNDAISMIPADEKAALQSIIDTPMPAARSRAEAGGGSVVGGGRGGAAAAPAAPGAAAPAVAAAPGAAAPAGVGGGRGGPPVVTPGFKTNPANLFVPIGRNQAITDPEQTAITRFDENIEKELTAQRNAAEALTAAAYALPANPNTVAARAQDLANADFALAQARAAGFTKLLGDLKVPAERRAAFVTAVTTRGGRGGGGGGAGAAAGAGAAGAAPARGAAPAATAPALPAGRGN